MGKSFDRSYRLREQARARYRDIFSTARMCGYPQSWMLEQRNIANLPLAGAPRWVTSYLQGVWDEAMFQLDRNDLVYGYRFPDGTTYLNHRVRLPWATDTTANLIAAGRGAELKDVPCVCFWRDSGKIFFGA